ncbi:uncharacterized protein FIBRA_03449 [Fibroporia radiculosa]|uniref:Protein kinase domain-containing protein n=1 Tax=Fibroporia radiculosa TaxID=599839 RepID=J4G5J4_9APHY|nr:uncharacterized protein FIBRA_03449 [Fibroporia radiculosa]CCM01398.1 predicted protein [Fibroporia radiculosa]
MESSVSGDLLKKREYYRAQIATALEEDPDPLAAYDGFVRWTLENYGKDELAQSGLLELLEESTRKFKDDAAYKGDLRYLKLWLLYASHIEDPTVIYAFLLENNIGAVYAQLYWEYAAALERSRRRSEAEAIYKQGIRRRARPLDPLTRRYEDFKNRSESTTPPQVNSNASIWAAASLDTQALRRNPLKNYTQISSYSESHVQLDSTSGQNHDRYALMLAPPLPGKRREELRFRMQLLFTEDRIEYSMQEARARSMGLLGKKWGPPPPSDATQVESKRGQGARGTRNFTGRKGFAEPTVTLATKEALADVFGMYNSPEKSMRFGAVVGSKHAPVRKIEPIAPLSLHGQLRAVSNENAPRPAKTPRDEDKPVVSSKTPIQPFVDESVKRKENSTPAPPKFKPFVDAEQSTKLPTFTPNLGRRALSVKETTTPAPTLRPSADENALTVKRNNALKPLSDETKPPPVFFTPLATAPKDRPQARYDVFTDENEKQKSTGVSPVENISVFTPYKDSKPPVKVFSRPPTRSGNASSSAAQAGTFQPYVDEDSEPQPASRTVLGDRTPFRAVPQPVSEPLEELQEEYEESYIEDEEPYEVVHYDDTSGTSQSEDDSLFDDENGDDGYHAPLGGRFGQFNVMTPITERTLEYTASMRGSTTPRDVLDGIAVYRDPVETAEQLAAELREEDIRDEEGDDSDLASATEYIEEKTGTLSLSDVLSVASSFKPPNPCNPFDPPIMSTLLSLIPPDHDFHDIRQYEAHQLDALQKFAKKKSRRTSGNTTTSRALEDAETFPLIILDRHFAVIDKLGEGGFGSVFEAIDQNMASRDDDMDDEEESDESTRVALKIVKPRNLWEFHVLRRIHRTLPAQLRQSIISPQVLYAFRDESFLVLELCKQGTLLDIVNRASQAGITQQGACLDELLVVFFTIELMRLLEGLHRAGFIHGDVKVDNCLLRLEDVPGPASAWSSLYQPSGEGGWSRKGIKMIDFGRTIDTRLFPASQQYIAEWPTDARDCIEIRENRSWTYQTDYFGLAGIIYCMLYGKYIEASSVITSPPTAERHQRYKLATPLKRYWQVDLWTRLFDLLLNPCLIRPDGQLPVCDELLELRVEMESWLQANCNRASNSLKGLLKKIGIYILGGKDGR